MLSDYVKASNDSEILVRAIPLAEVSFRLYLLKAKLTVVLERAVVVAEQSHNECHKSIHQSNLCSFEIRCQ